MNDIPRRAQLNLLTPAEQAIYDAMAVVESMPADVRLTDAVVLLGAARHSVADFVDGIDTRRYVTESAAPVSEEIAKLKDYVQHKPECPRHLIVRLDLGPGWVQGKPHIKPCTCGLDTLLSIREPRLTLHGYRCVDESADPRFVVVEKVEETYGNQE